MAIRQNIHRLQKLYQGWSGLQKNDYLFCSYPRSGSTWFRFIFCNILAIQELDNAPVDFNRLNETMVEYGVNNLQDSWQFNTLPRLVKTHWKYQSALFGKTPSIGIIRDPRDVMLSFYRYQEKFVGKDVASFSEFIQNPKDGLPAWFAHYNSWKNRWAYTIQYEQLKTNPAETILNPCQFLNTNVTQETILEAINRADIKKVQAIAKDQLVMKDNTAQFAKSGTSTWQDRFSQNDLAYYESLCNQHALELYR